ncbi:MAG: hypothetical protein XD49_0995 [Caldanaerobacter subterraneus]|jgi:hypothetical protein|uniref:Uncharacterized protein n=3 Tax=Caldanaerobacter subterraneus TaxID=911092 RepID=Q8R7R7_CALS4|nr:MULTISPECIES: hypothetical protein [Caldanaerobacter]AAM25472.1 hypothetical protein TTE2331 [Caldanaerobacter subterraneus subsp. tengcongensis MB4]KKC28945.1 hypothetical protein CDSM653_02027 [Caldanaerobacter subterraneus subsp. pacificus DSM 12653]KUK08955.1 MAG: hypothetical protein XD49_0995 [Caldanaerobacter subterraneus]MBE3579950.1 hypothetical protein [Caldanaerobacter subterraneus]MCS3914924.1 hypothetical protein [Caldanaerobacter subterraneus subsp. tengcongensis MB4]
MKKGQKFFKGKLYKSLRSGFFEEEVYEVSNKKAFKNKSNFSNLLNQEEVQETLDEREENYENE